MTDTRGSVMALTDNAGNVTNRYAYDPWGAPDLQDIRAISETVPQPLRYRGYWYDGWVDEQPATSGQTAPMSPGAAPWYALGTRSYDPVLERYLQPDASATPRDYTYAHDDPHDQCDPTGSDAGCPQLHGHIIRGAPYDPRTFAVPYNTTAQIINSFTLLWAGGTAARGDIASAGTEGTVGGTLAAASGAQQESELPDFYVDLNGIAYPTAGTGFRVWESGTIEGEMRDYAGTLRDTEIGAPYPRR